MYITEKYIDGTLKYRGTFTAQNNHHRKEYKFTIYVSAAESNINRALVEELNLII